MNEPTGSWESWLLSRVKLLFARLGADFLVQSCLLILFYSSVIYGMVKMVPRLDTVVLAQPVFMGLLVGWLAAASRLNAWRSWIILIGCGLCVTVGSLGDLGEPALRVAWFVNSQAMARHVVFTSYPLQSISGLSRLLEADMNIWGNLETILLRSETWFSSLIQGKALFDTLITSMVWGMALWILGTWSSWSVRRWNQPVLAVLPAGILLSISMAYTGVGITPLLGVIISTLILLAWNGFSRKLNRWVKDGIDYAEDLRLDVSLTASVLTVVFVFLASLAPVLSIQQFGDLVDRFRPEFGERNQETGESLGLEIIPGNTAEPTTFPPRKIKTNLNGVGLPRQHLLRSGPELSNELVMTVSTGDLPRLPFEMASTLRAPRYYWRAVSYDQYNGRGWQTSQVEIINNPPGGATHPGFILFPVEGREQIIHPYYRRAGIHLVNQAVKPEVNFEGLVFTAGEMLGLNGRYHSLWRLPPNPSSNPEGDLYAALSLERTWSYLAWSAVSSASAAELDQAGVDYPSWVKERYLTLPDNLPERVVRLADEITTGKVTPYRQAAAIEAFLRTYPYTLDLPEPPTDRDVVDYFLFDIQRGYCDYYASAMVVLARIAGLPARLVIGYASGVYNPEEAAYRVSEADGHSWPEIYFPGYGWVEFEPTAGLPEIERPVGELPRVSQIMPPEQLDIETPQLVIGKWVVVIVGGPAVLFLILAAWILSEPRRYLHLTPVEAIHKVFCRLHTWGQWLGLAPGEADTPFEYAVRLSGKLSQLQAPGSRHKWIDTSRQAITRIASIYSYSIYSAHPPTVSDRHQALSAWGWLRWRLFRARLLKSKKSTRVEK